MAQFIDFEVDVETDAGENEVSDYDSDQILYRLLLTIKRTVMS